MTPLVTAALLAAAAPPLAPAEPVRVQVADRVVTVEFPLEPAVCEANTHWYAADHAPTKAGAQRPGDVAPEALDAGNAFGTESCAAPLAPMRETKLTSPALDVSSSGAAAPKSATRRAAR